MGVQFASSVRAGADSPPYVPAQVPCLPHAIYALPLVYSYWIDGVNPAFQCRRHRRVDGNLRINLCGYAQIRPNAFGDGGLGDVNGLCSADPLPRFLCALVNPRIATRLASRTRSPSLPSSPRLMNEAIKAALGKTSC